MTLRTPTWMRVCAALVLCAWPAAASASETPPFLRALDRMIRQETSAVEWGPIHFQHVHAGPHDSKSTGQQNKISVAVAACCRLADSVASL